MPPIPPLFTVPVPPSGSITCTQRGPKIYLLTFLSPPDNRLTPTFCSSFLLALDILEYRFPKGIVITTSAIPKFYSNGLNYESATKSKSFFSESLYPLWRRLLTYEVSQTPVHKGIHTLTLLRKYSYPMPTLALINGHAFAAGLMTAMMHDYRLFNPHRGYLCLNELDFGAPLKPPMASIFRQKLPSPATYRTLVLESKRFNALEALKEGIVDGLGGLEEALAFAEEMKLVEKGGSGVYGRLKAEMWKETVRLLENAEGSARRAEREEADEKRRGGESLRRVEEWERNSRNGIAKL
ncbi:MAG: hypothetical protein M1830_008978 [Pleopsidium flavum]|nr:MAG: hypothetical protein M1830_008978 [Pleopsidium flavum]